LMYMVAIECLVQNQARGWNDPARAGASSPDADDKGAERREVYDRLGVLYEPEEPFGALRQQRGAGRGSLAERALC